MRAEKRHDLIEQVNRNEGAVKVPKVANTDRFDDFPDTGPALMVFRKEKGIATKRIWRENGRIEKDGSACSSFTGGYARELHLGEDAPLEKLSRLIQSVNKSELLTYGTAANASGSWMPAMTKATFIEADSPDTAITRSNDHLAFVESPGVMSGDYDPSTGQSAMHPEELIAALRAVCPPLADVDILWRPSSGSCIYDIETGDEEVGITGQRLWIAVKDASDLPRFGKLVNDRAVLQGHGWVFISKTGNMEVRSLLDSAMFGPAQPDYVAGAVVKPDSGIEQRLPDPQIHPGSQRILDTRLFPDLSYEEGEQLKAIKERLIQEARPQAERIKLEYRKTHAKCLEDTFGYPEAKAREIVNSRLGRDLLASDVLYFDHLMSQKDYAGTRVSEVLTTSAAFDDKTLADPLEPDYRGTPGSIVSGKAKLFINGTTSRPMIHSFAHSSQKYRLWHDRDSLLELFETQKDKGGALDWMQPMLNAKLSKTDKTAVLKLVAETTGHNIRDLRSDLDDHETKQERARGESTFPRREGDCRTRILVDPSNWNSMVEEVSRVMCGDLQAKPLFNYGGRVVKILMRLPDGNISAAHPSVLYSRLIRHHDSLPS